MNEASELFSVFIITSCFYCDYMLEYYMSGTIRIINNSFSYVDQKLKLLSFSPFCLLKSSFQCDGSGPPASHFSGMDTHTSNQDRQDQAAAVQ